VPRSPQRWTRPGAPPLFPADVSKRVLYVHFAPDIDGSVTSLTTLLKYLDRDRYEPLVVQAHPVFGRAVERFTELGIALDHVPVTLVWPNPWLAENNLRGRAWKGFSASAAALAYLERLRPDIVHLNDFAPVPFALAAKQLRLPIVWHCRLVLRHPQSPFRPVRRLIRTMTQVADRIIPIAEPEAKPFLGDNTTIVYNPVDLERIGSARGSGGAFRAQHGIGPEEYLVTAPVALNVPKGGWDFIDGCVVAARRAPNVRFRFCLAGAIPTDGRRHQLRRYVGIGPEPVLQKVARILRSGGIEDRFLLPGFVDNVYSAIDASDLIVFPSRLKACGRPCFEAGAMGKPVLVTMPDTSTGVVLHGRTGLILPEADAQALGAAIARLGLDPAEGKRMGAAGMAYVPERFDARAHARRVMEIYDELLHQTRRPALASATGAA
jgi:glycosyltransferase involved in cell wall biosynthesis